ncbi:MAG: penicillin-binding transpeptidase domain-containing protein [Chloroflexota bacterium]|nr:penicillin-binding transpeptidase domain-containing protein [Chloroflexota bacterium]
MITTNVRRLGLYLLLGFAVMSGGLAYWQVIDAPQLAAREDNPQVIAARRSQPRGTIFDARGEVLASSTVTDGVSRRSYSDAAFSHLIGYASLRFGTTGIEGAFDDLLIGRADPNPIRDLVGEILARQPEPKDLTLTVDKRLQDFAAAQLGSSVGAVVALDPTTGAILASTSTPTFDATPISGDPEPAGAAMDAIRAQPNNPLVARDRQGRYTPGSIMKVFTAAAALDAGAITPQTTFPDQPKQETEGFTVDGFRITEHDLSPVQPALWALSPALQVSSNIYFAHVGLELGAERFLDYARRFGFCSSLAIGPSGRELPVIPSYVTASTDGDCAPFSDRVELASAAFGQARVDATPVQMALVAATIANGGVMPHPFVVRDVRSHSDGVPSTSVLETYGGDGGGGVVSGRTAATVRSVMIDAVEGQLGSLYAGAGAVKLYGVSGVQTAGKTGTAQRGESQQPHSWFIGFAPAQEGAKPAIAIAVLIEGGGSGSGNAAPIGGAVMAEWLKLQAGG